MGVSGEHLGRLSKPCCVFAVDSLLKYTGYGNAAGLLAARGLLAGGRGDHWYSENEDTDTEEYKNAKPKYSTKFLFTKWLCLSVSGLSSASFGFLLWICKFSTYWSFRDSFK